MGFIGQNRTGKSVTAEQVATDWKSSRDDSYTVLAFDPQNRFKDIADFFIYAHEDWQSKILRLRNGLLIIDDLKALHPKNQTDPVFLELMSFRSEWNIDIIYIVHNPSLILWLFTYYTTHYFIFFTNSTEGGFKDKIPNYALCLAASRYINKYVKIYGRGDYPNFPHMIVDCEKEKLFAMNMSTKYLKN